MAVFTVTLGDKEVTLPEADTRDEALVKAGLNPQHWQVGNDTVTKPPEAGKRPVRVKKPVTTRNIEIPCTLTISAVHLKSLLRDI